MPPRKGVLHGTSQGCSPPVPLSTLALLLLLATAAFLVFSPEANRHLCQVAKDKKTWRAEPRSSSVQDVTAEQGAEAGEQARAARTLPPPVPSKGYIITLEPNSTRYKQSVEAIEGIRVVTDLVTVDGIVVDMHAYATGTKKTKDMIKLGLMRSHMKVWQQLLDDGVEEAWVFEDDVVFHDEWDTLFPQYWQQVPAVYDFIWVGSCSSCHTPPGERNATVVLGPKCYPWCIHAYIVSRSMAEHLLLHANLKFARADMKRIPTLEYPYDNFTTTWYLDEYDISADNLIGSQYHWLTRTAEKSRWVVFKNTEEVPARWLGVSWVQGHWYGSKCQCWCDARNRRRCIQSGTVPVHGRQNGLAYQQSCAKLDDPTMISTWREEVAAYLAEKGLSTVRTVCGKVPL